jgi:hypothetical protein
MIKKPTIELISTWVTKPNDEEIKIWELILPIAETFLFEGGIEESQSFSSLSGEEEWIEDLEKLASGDPIYFPLHAMIRHSIDMSEINSVLTTEQYNMWQRFKSYLADKEINDLDRYYFEQLKKKLKSNIFEDNIIPYYIFIDTETTGRPEDYDEPPSNTNNWPRLVQIAWLIYDRDCNLISENVKIIKPDGFLIPDEAIQIHNINNIRATKEGENLKAVLELLLDDAKNSTAFVGHNIVFDLNIISSEFYRIYGFDFLQTIVKFLATEVLNGQH